MTLQFPLPPYACSQNARVHWSVRSAATKRYRTACALICASVKHVWREQCEDTPIRLHITMHGHRAAVPDGCYRPNDIGNLTGAIKPLIDGIVDAGIVPDDSHRWVQYGDIKLLRNKRISNGKPRLEIRFERIINKEADELLPISHQ